MSKSSETHTASENAIIHAVGVALAHRLQANASCALEAPSASAEFDKLAHALLAAVAASPQDDLGEDFTASFLERQLQKEADIVASNAEARAASRLRAAAELWQASLTAERGKRRRLALQTGGRS